MARSFFITFATIFLAVAVLLEGGKQPAVAAPTAEVVHGEQLAQRSSGSSRASIQRSPSRRALKVVSVGAGGGGGVGAECDEVSTMLAEGEIPDSAEGAPQSAHLVVYPQVSAATVSGYIPALVNQTFICVEPAIPSTGAVAVYGADIELPAAMAESNDELSIVALPALAYLQPGFWTLIANDGQHATVTGVWVPELEGPAAVYDGDSMLLAGFQPDERVAIAWFDYDAATEPGEVLDVEELAAQEGQTVEDILLSSAVFAASQVATLQVDDQGALLIDWPDDFQQDFVVAGERTPDLITTWYGSVHAGDSTGELELDYATLAAAADTDAGAEGFAPGDRVRNISSGLIMVRRTPGYVDKPGGDVVRRVRVGEEMEITGASVEADELTWWPVRYLSTTGAQVDGWVAEVAPDGDLLLRAVE